MFFQRNEEIQLVQKNVFPNEVGKAAEPKLLFHDDHKIRAAPYERENKPVVITPVAQKVLEFVGRADETVPWQEFDEKTYVDKTRVKPGEDSYAKNKFNQLASDNIKANRGVPDTRHQLWVGGTPGISCEWRGTPRTSCE